MAEEQEDSGSAEGNIAGGAIVGEVLDPEKGPTGTVITLQETAEKALEEHLLEVVNCILDNVRQKHLPSAKLLVDLAARVKAGKDVPQEVYRSLAEELWMQYRRTGNRE